MGTRNINATNLICSVIEHSKNTINKIYSLFYTPTKIGLLENKIIRTQRGGKESYNSLQYTQDGFQELFNDNSNEFKVKFGDATSGLEKGNNRIYTLHSSALLPFLTFYKVTKANPIIIPLPVNEEGNTLEVGFTNSIFEYGFQIQDSSHDSKIDVTLFDEIDIESSNNVLLLESKFTEYITKSTKGAYKISRKYEGILTIDPIMQFFENNDLSCKLTNNAYFLKSKNSNSQFCEGVKQMLCHYLGALDYAKRNPSKIIYLGTIIFNFGEQIKKAKELFDRYTKLYKRLSTVLNGLKSYNDEQYKCPSNLIILSEALTYNQIFQSDFTFNKNARTIYSNE